MASPAQFIATVQALKDELGALESRYTVYLGGAPADVQTKLDDAQAALAALQTELESDT